MSNLKDKKCASCEGGVIPFDISEIHKYQKKVDGWDISKDNKTNFFNLGFKNKWQQNLPEEISNKIKNKFFNELKELNYE